MTSSFVDDVIIYCQLCLHPIFIGQVLKCQDIIIPLNVLLGALHYLMSALRQFFVTVVLTHYLQYLDPKCIGQVIKSPDIIIRLQSIYGALYESDVRFVTSLFRDDLNL